METEYVWEVTYTNGRTEIFYDKDKCKVAVLREYLNGIHQFNSDYPADKLIYDTQTWIVFNYIKGYCQVKKIEWETWLVWNKMEI